MPDSIATQPDSNDTRAWPRAPLLLVASSSRTGPAELQITAARYLRNLRIDARFAADTTQPGDIKARLEEARIPLLDLRMSRKVKLRHIFHDAVVLNAWVAQGRPDLLHAAFAHDHHLCLWAAWNAGAARRDLRIVRTAHRREDVEPGRLGHRLRALRATDGVVVHAESYRRRLLSLGLPENRLLYLPGAVDAQRFTPGRDDALRAEWGVPAEAPLAGIVSRMKPERNHRQLIDAFARAPAAAHLVLVGRGDSERELRARVDGLPAELRARIHFGGYRAGDELVRAYRALDVAVWLREGNDGACRGVLEAMACGKPMIAGKEGAPGELVRHEVDGLLVDANDPISIGDALKLLLSELPRSKVAEMAASARRRAEDHTADRYGATLLAFYRRLRELPPVSWRGKPLLELPAPKTPKT